MHLGVGARWTSQQRRRCLAEVRVEEGAYVCAGDGEPARPVDGAEEPEETQTQRHEVDGVIGEVKVRGPGDAEVIARTWRYRAQDRLHLLLEGTAT